MQEQQIVAGITNAEVLKVIVAIFMVHGASIFAGLYAFAKFGITHLLQYHDLKRDVTESKQRLEKLEKDVHAAHNKLRTK